LNAADRASLIAAAKARATAVVSCVQARLSPSHILDRCSREDLAALVIVLAECADPAVLRAVVNARDDDGKPDLSRREVMLRKARTEAARLRRGNQHVPARIGDLEREYWRTQKGAERSAAREKAA
jgi:hypothetical protein